MPERRSNRREQRWLLQGYYFFPGVVGRDRVRLVQRDIAAVNRR
ncbi:hypothetical protein [Williamsia muralis]|nr:hypothetical protein [Williamsia marianensis]